MNRDVFTMKTSRCTSDEKKRKEGCGGCSTQEGIVTGGGTNPRLYLVSKVLKLWDGFLEHLIGLVQNLDCKESLSRSK